MQIIIANGLTCQQVGLPEPDYMPPVQQVLSTALAELQEVERQVNTLNPEQRFVCDRIMAARQAATA